MKQLKFGVIGLGNMGGGHLAQLRKIPEAVVTAVCDNRQEALDHLSPELAGNARKFSDDETFFREADVDVVTIATPHYSHPDLAVRAMECGKHVLVEKPVAVHKAEAERLIREAAKYPELKKSAMFNMRTMPAYKKIKQMIESGELGTIRRACWIITTWFRSQHYYDSGDWRASWRGEGGGVLLNQCPHQLDLFQWFFGLPETVDAHAKFGKYHDIEVEDEVNAYMEYANGMTANFIASTGEAPGTNRLEITAEKGRLVFEDGKLEFLRNEVETSVFCKTAKTLFSGPPTWHCSIPFETQTESPHLLILKNLTAAILHGEELVAPLEEGIRGLELGNAMMLSEWTHGPVRLPIDAAQYAGFLQERIRTSRYKKTSAAGSYAGGADMNKSFNLGV